MARNIMAVVDLQFGSTGKGQIAGTLAHKWDPDTVVTAWGPNAGHTFRNGENSYISRMLASSAIAPSVKDILIGPGSVVDLDMLATEILDRGRRNLRGKRLVIHPQATILGATDARNEADLVRIGSTMKGTAEAAIRKIRRTPEAVAKGRLREVVEKIGEACFETGVSLAVSSVHYDRAIDRAHNLLVEGAQGYSLGLHTDFYPHTTGRDVSTSQLFADCRIPWTGKNTLPPVVIGTARTFPIRVANRYVEAPDLNAEVGLGGIPPLKRIQVGTSGGCYDDQEEISWDAVGKPVELTTVTQLPRRVFTFSMQQIWEAARICGPSYIALTFCDYLKDDEPFELARKIHRTAGVPVRLMSFGPDMADVRKLDLLRYVALPWESWE